ncbi:MAG: phosphatase PAP2 family protein [Prolixibacteraceae bacterium]|nr:phosphatase PAP2 family protein [Prolixibacteraceae bacterium]
MRKLSLLLVFCFSLNILLQANSNKDSTAVVCTVIKHGLKDTRDLVLSPIKWKCNEWITAGGVTLATGALIAWGDQTVYDFSNTLHNNTTDFLGKIIQPMGNYYPISAIAGFFTYGLLAKDNYSLETSLIAAESIFLSTCMVQSVKYLAGRVRPNDFGTSNPHQWQGPFTGDYSFYSGHTTAVFSVASVFAYRYRDVSWVPFLCYGLAALGGMERIFDNRHWASDVLLGAAIGTANGIFLCKCWEKSPIKFFPVVSTDRAQLSVIIPINK